LAFARQILPTAIGKLGGLFLLRSVDHSIDVTGEYLWEAARPQY
jgi:hypothetical protein